MRGILSWIKKEEFKPKKANIDTKVTENKLVLKGYPKLNKLIEASVYENKPVNYTSIVSDELKWAVKEKEWFKCWYGWG